MLEEANRHAAAFRRKSARRSAPVGAMIAAGAVVLLVVLGMIVWVRPSGLFPPDSVEKTERPRDPAKLPQDRGGKSTAQTGKTPRQKTSPGKPPDGDGDVSKTEAKSGATKRGGRVKAILSNPAEPAEPELEAAAGEPAPSPLSVAERAKPEIAVAPAATEPGKLPVPSDAEQDKARKLVDEVHQSEIAAARTAEQRSDLAKKLLLQGRETTGSAADRYMLWTRALELAEEVGDGLTAYEAIDELAGIYEVDGLEMKAKLLTKFSKTPRCPTPGRPGRLGPIAGGGCDRCRERPYRGKIG